MCLQDFCLIHLQLNSIYRFLIAWSNQCPWRNSWPSVIIFDILKHFMLIGEKWATILLHNARLTQFIKEGLKWADKYYHRMGDTKVYLIAMGKHVWTWKCMFVFLISSHCEATQGQKTKNQHTWEFWEERGGVGLGSFECKPKESLNGEPPGAGLHSIYTIIHEGCARLSVGLCTVHDIIVELGARLYDTKGGSMHSMRHRSRLL